MSELTTEQMEEFVREKWKFVEYHCCDARGSYALYGAEGAYYSTNFQQDAVTTWKVAYEHTVALLEEIRCLEREMEVVDGMVAVFAFVLEDARRRGNAEDIAQHIRNGATSHRLFQRLEAILAEKKRGLK